jgi:hypothetical protein
MEVWPRKVEQTGWLSPIEVAQELLLPSPKDALSKAVQSQ